jgi:type I restriction enzyme S subunit
MNWDKKTLGEIYKIEGGSVQTGPFGSQLHESDYKDFGVPVIMPKDIKNDKLDLSNISFISDDDAKRLSQHIVKKDDIVCPRRGEIGKRILIDEENIGAFCGTGCIRLRGTGTILNQLFFFYFLKQPNVVKWIENQAIGATMMNLNTSILKSIPVKYPPLPYQQKIASILSSYDELIENNKQRIKLLEEMAEEIYKEWFVRLRFPGYEDAKIVDDLPEGWENVKLNSFCKFPYGSMPNDKNDNFSNEYPYEIQSGHGCKGYTSQNNIERPRIIITVRGSVGRVEIIYKKCWVTNLAVITKYSSKCKSMHFLFHELRNKNLEWLNTGSAIPQITSNNLGFVRVLLPDEKIQIAYENLISPFYEEIQVLKMKIEFLKQTRDLLLPRLISGKLSVEHLLDKNEELLMDAEPSAEYSKSN